MKHSFHGALKARGPSEGSVAGELRSETQAVGREGRKPQVGLPPLADKVSLNACGRVGHAVEEIGGLRSESPGARRRVMAQTCEKPPIRNRIRPARRTRGTRHAEAVVEDPSLGVPCNRPGGAQRCPRTEAVHGEDPRPRVFVAVLCVRVAQVRTGPADFEKEPGLRIVARRPYGGCEPQQARRHVGGKNPLRSKSPGADRGKGSGPEAPRPISIERVEKEVVRRRDRPELREPPLRPDTETCVGHGLHGRQGRNVGNQQVFAAQVQIDLRGVEFVGQKPESRQGAIGANDRGHDKTPSEDQKFFRHPPSVRTDRKPS